MRKEIKWFANEMEKALQENDYKGGWHDEDFDFLFERLTEEKKELRNCFCRFKKFLALEPKDSKTKNQIIREAVDVANFVMMIADKVFLG
jgi:NTP pyrophosphatase (non-canonical NTP hydrolase)